MKVTYYGHSCCLVEINGSKLLFDPFISPNEKASHISVNEIACDYILLSHGHEDHMADLEQIAKSTGAKLISNYELVVYFEEKGIKGHPLNHGGQSRFDFGKVKFVNAVHSSVLPDGTYGGNAGGFVISAGEETFYYAGDTALHMDMQLIGRMFNIDLAILPIGDNFTMGTEEAIIASEFIKCKEILGVHFDTFGYIEINKKETIQQFKSADCNLTLLEIGTSANF